MIAYALLTANPLTEAQICWLDTDGGELSIEFDGDTFVDDDPTAVPESDYYRYSVVIDGLEPGSEHNVVLPDEDTRTYQTLPEEPPITVGFTSDHHPFRGDNGIANVSPNPMIHFAEQDPDLILFGGDVITSGSDGPSGDISDDWMFWWEEIMGPVFDDRLRPMLAVPGNHDMDNGCWHPKDERKYDPGDTDDMPSTPTDPDENYWHTWFPNIRDLGPNERNYGAVTVGDYLQVIGIDTHSADPFGDQLDWFKDVHDPDVDVCIPFKHFPIFPGVQRDEGQCWEFRDYARHTYCHEYYIRDNIRFHINGNEHCWKDTHRYTIADEPPDDPDKPYVQTNPHGEWPGESKYCIMHPEGTSDPNAVREVGDGWMVDRSGSAIPEGDASNEDGFGDENMLQSYKRVGDSPGNHRIIEVGGD